MGVVFGKAVMTLGVNSSSLVCLSDRRSEAPSCERPAAMTVYLERCL